MVRMQGITIDPGGPQAPNAPHFTGMTLEEAVATAESGFDSPY